MKKKLLLMTLLLCAVAQGAWADKWDGSKTEKPRNDDNVTITIRNAAQLAYIRDHWDDIASEYYIVEDLGEWGKFQGMRHRKDYKEMNYHLACDLDMTAADWQPLGGAAYSATFDGHGHTIRFKNRNENSANYQGLFAYIGGEGIVKNLRVETDIKVGNARLVGGIAGDNEGTIENCWVTGDIESSHYNSAMNADLGGIAGLNDGGTIKYCYYKGNVKNTGGNTGVGGFVGRNYKNIEHCTFIGHVEVSRSQHSIFVGIENGSTKSCYDSFVWSEYNADASKDLYRDGIRYPSLHDEAVENPSSPALTIKTVDDWNTLVRYIHHRCTFDGLLVQLAADITVKTMVGTSEMCVFQGTFDGDGHTITLQMDGAEFKGAAGAAPFRNINGATIKNLTVVGNVNTQGADHTSALVGYSYGTDNNIVNCEVTANVSGHRASGFVGNALSSTVTVSGCVFDGMLNGNFNTAFIGWGDNDGTKVVNHSLYLKPGNQKTTNLDLVGGNASFQINNTYKNTEAGSYGKIATVHDSDPGDLGSVVPGGEYGKLKAYEHGILFNGKYYKDASQLYQGQGTAESPYEIASTADWDNIALCVSQGYTYAGKYFLLTQDITVTKMVGINYNTYFSGTFDGGGHLLTFNCDATDRYPAPFHSTFDSTIKNLRTAGTINTNYTGAGGIVGQSHGSLTLTNCRSSVTINSGVRGEGHHGGLIGYSSQYYQTTIDRCVFEGVFNTTEGTIGCGGFIGDKVGTRYAINNSVMKPKSVAPGMLVGTFVPFLQSSGKYPISNCYSVYAENLPDNQGVQVYKDHPDDKISRQQPVDGENCWIPCKVDADWLYSYTGKDIDVKVRSVTDPDGTTLTPGTDYTYTPTTVKDAGTYNVVVTGHGKYSGSMALPFMVGNGKEEGHLSSGVYTVHENLTTAERVYVFGDVVINIPEGVTLNAKKGFKVIEVGGRSTTLTINGPGALVIDGCDDGNAGIQLESNNCALVINGGKITVKGGNNAAGIGANAGKQPTGKVTLGWTDTDDYIYCDGYAVSSITFAEGKDFQLDGTSNKATAGNINGEYKKIVPYGKAGTEVNPLVINCADDWNYFVNTLSQGKDYSGKLVKLTADIDGVSTMAGVWAEKESERRPFSGTFDGNNHTITANITDENNQGIALFGYINGATIKNLNVAGTITGGMHAAAIVGFSGGKGNSIANCVATANVSGNSHIGGLVGNALDGDITISGCVVSGLMTGTATTKGAIIGWSDDGGTKKVSDCLYLVADGQDTRDLDFVKGNGAVTVTNCYKTTIEKSAQSRQQNSQKGRKLNRHANNTTADEDITDLEAYGIWANVYDVKPDYFGELVSDYGFLKVYEGGLEYQGHYYVASISLTDHTDNSALIDLTHGHVVDATLSDYTLYKDGRWHTLCLPFNLSVLKGSPLEGAKVMMLGSSATCATGFDATTGTMTLEFVESDRIEAGIAYIVKWEISDDYDGHESDLCITNPLFRGVTIANEDTKDHATTSSDRSVQFVGTYNTTNLFNADKNNFCIDFDGTIWYPWGEGVIDFYVNACTAYFQLQNGLTAGDATSDVSSFKLIFGDESTDILDVRNKTDEKRGSDACYSLDGRRYSGKPSQKGIYINNGKKIVIN